MNTPRLPLYLDHHATTPIDPRVLQAMLPYFTEKFGNPGSDDHPYGWQAAEAVQIAREQVATLLGASPHEIIFTSGATESNNLALLGAARFARQRDPKKCHIMTSGVEHQSILAACMALEREGFRITILGTDATGRVAPSDVSKAIDQTTSLISLQWANNEIGTLQPLAEVGEIAKSSGVLLHSDAVQGLSYLPFHVDQLGVDLVSLSGHKIYGPKGVGALYLRRKNPRAEISALIWGGGQERGLRSGTLNVPGIVGLGVAAEIAFQTREVAGPRVALVRNLLLQQLLTQLGGEAHRLKINGPIDQNPGDPLSTRRLPQNLSVTFKGLTIDALKLKIRSDLAVSAASACLGGTGESHVLRCILKNSPDAPAADAQEATIRLGLGRSTTEKEAIFAATVLANAVKELSQ